MTYLSLNAIFTKLKIYVMLFAGIFFTVTTILYNQSHKQMRKEKKIKWHIFIFISSSSSSNGSFTIIEPKIKIDDLIIDTETGSENT